MQCTKTRAIFRNAQRTRCRDRAMPELRRWLNNFSSQDAIQLPNSKKAFEEEGTRLVSQSVANSHIVRGQAVRIESPQRKSRSSIVEVHWIDGDQGHLKLEWVDSSRRRPRIAYAKLAVRNAPSPKGDRHNGQARNGQSRPRFGHFQPCIGRQREATSHRYRYPARYHAGLASCSPEQLSVIGSTRASAVSGMVLDENARSRKLSFKQRPGSPCSNPWVLTSTTKRILASNHGASETNPPPRVERRALHPTRAHGCLGCWAARTQLWRAGDGLSAAATQNRGRACAPPP